MKKGNILMQAHSNGLGHCPDVKNLEYQCLLEVILVSQIILCMLVVDKAKGA